MISVLQNTTAIGLGVSTPFLATGGTAPYVYSVQAGGAGGTINSSTGVYTAPNVIGIDTIIATDNVAATGSTTINIMNALQLVCDIVQTEMGLANGRVYLWDQQIDEPIDSELFIVVSTLMCRPFGNSISYSNGVTYQSINMWAQVTLDVISKNPDARDRKEEVIMALASTYSEQQQEANSFNIGKISTSFVNLSNVDGSTILYRFQISVGIQYSVTKTSSDEYYATFPTPTVIEN